MAGRKEEIKDTVFIGGIPRDLTFDQFEDELAVWGHVVKKYLRDQGGWGTVTFDSNSNRNRFLKDKSKHKIGNKCVDVQAFFLDPDRPRQAESSGPSHLVIGQGKVKMASDSALRKKNEAIYSAAGDSRGSIFILKNIWIIFQKKFFCLFMKKIYGGHMGKYGGHMEIALELHFWTIGKYGGHMADIWENRADIWELYLNCTFGHLGKYGGNMGIALSDIWEKLANLFMTSEIWENIVDIFELHFRTYRKI
jgi:hypothetical protein